jgi:hypothetical protein
MNAAQGRGIAVPVFLVGSERSGTTLLRLMLDNHPEIAFQHEFELSVEHVGEDGRWPDLAEFHDFLSTYRYASFVYDVDRSIKDYPSLVKAMLEQKRQRDKKPRLGATVHLWFDRLLHIWPDASFIKLTRDGRDVARSNIGMGWAGNVYFGVERWITAEHLWSKVKARVPEERRIEVRYEDLVTDPVKELTRVCKWFGVDYSPKMLEYMNTELGKNYKYPDPKLAYQWKKKLSKREIQLVEARIGPMLVERGYPLSEHRPITVTPVELRYLRAQNRFAIAKHRLDTFGVKLWAESMLARRIGPKWWRDDVQLRINKIIDANLD